MGLNGMSFLVQLREENCSVSISETHPKVLWYELAGKKYDYESSHQEMDRFIGHELGLRLFTKNDHEWDAAISVLALWNGLSGCWLKDLHSLECSDRERIVAPCGQTNYWWPEGEDT
jgi:hypothetical protein